MAQRAGSEKFFGCTWESSWTSPGDCGDRYLAFFDQVTPENAGKWGRAEPQRGTFEWKALDAMYACAQRHDLRTRQHTFVWGLQQPDWIDTCTDSGTVRSRVSSWIEIYMRWLRGYMGEGTMGGQPGDQDGTAEAP